MNFLAAFLKGMSTVIVLGVIVAALLNLSIAMGVQEKGDEYKGSFKYSSDIASCRSDEKGLLCVSACSDTVFRNNFSYCCDSNPLTVCSAE